VPIAHTFQSALRSAESALTRGSKSVVEESSPNPLTSSLRHLREVLATTAEQKPGELPARFDRYLEVVATHCGHRAEPARVHFEIGFERMTEKLVQLGALDAKSMAALSSGLERAAGTAKSVDELEKAYRSAVRDVVDAVEKPVDARRDRSLRSALDYIHQHFTEDLTVKRVARVAGFNSSYFSTLFKERERVSFGGYVQRMRLARAQELLRTTDLSVTRVAELSGYRSLPYFCRAFQRALGTSPSDYRMRQSAATRPTRRRSTRSKVS